MRWLPLGMIWLGAFLFSTASHAFYNDHFDRIARARQIAQYGELPFRDFFDPGYFMTEFTSAGLQFVLGDNLLGEFLLNCVFLAAGATLIAALSWRVSRSITWGAAAATLFLLTLPRAYDFDKSLFYPLGIALCWHYVAARTTSSIWMLALGVVVAALYRYDTGLYIMAAAVVGMAIVHAGDGKGLRRNIGLLAAAIVCLSLPALIFLQATSGLLNAADQVVSYARREAARTRFSSPPRISIANIVSVQPPVAQTVGVRWAGTVDESARRAAEGRHSLSGGVLQGAPEDRTWSYSIRDSSLPSLDALVHDPDVEDTSGIDRSSLELMTESRWIRAQRAFPPLRLRLFPGSWHSDNADAFLYYFLRLLPLMSALALVVGLRSVSLPREEVARVAGLVVLCLAVNVFVLREPVAARVGGMAGPATILSVWLLHGIWNVRNASWRAVLKTAALVVLVITGWSISASARWSDRLTRDLARPTHVVEVIRTISSSPPDARLMGDRQLQGLVMYLRECTSPTDRVLATWFAPGLYFFAQRGFAGGLPVMFGAHWSEPRFVGRSVERVDSRPPTVVVFPGTEFSGDYPLLSLYLAEHYRLAGTVDFSGEHSKNVFSLLIRKDARPASVHPATGLPCFS